MVWSPLLDSHWTLILHALVLLLHKHSSTLGIACWIITHYTRYCYSKYKYHCYSDTDTHDIIIACSWITDICIRYYTYHNSFLFMSHPYIDTSIQYTLSFHILVSSLYGCSVHSYTMFTHHCYFTTPVYMHVLFLYSCHMDHRSYCMSYCCMYIHAVSYTHLTLPTIYSV